jgi:hypothetical protein
MAYDYFFVHFSSPKLHSHYGLLVLWFSGLDILDYYIFSLPPSYSTDAAITLLYWNWDLTFLLWIKSASQCDSSHLLIINIFLYVITALPLAIAATGILFSYSQITYIFLRMLSHESKYMWVSPQCRLLALRNRTWVYNHSAVIHYPKRTMLTSVMYTIVTSWRILSSTSWETSMWSWPWKVFSTEQPLIPTAHWTQNKWDIMSP